MPFLTCITMSTKRKILLFLLLFVLATLTIGYYFYNKGPEDTRDSNALPVTANELYQAFAGDSLTAQQTYSGKVLLVTGVINKLDTNQQKEVVVSLTTYEPGAYINCSMEKLTADLKLNDQVMIKGFCSGIGQGDADLGIKADVYLTRCWITK